MAFQDDITEPALADAEDYVGFIGDVRKEPEAAERWFRGLVHANYSLEVLPERCRVIPESTVQRADEHMPTSLSAQSPFSAPFPPLVDPQTPIANLPFGTQVGHPPSFTGVARVF